MVQLGCVDCTVGSYYRPEFIYLYEGVSVCDFHLHQRRNGGLPVEVPVKEES